jgi:hypothetical protein
VPLEPILSARTLHTLIFALRSAPLAAASINFYRRASNDGTPRITVANCHAAHSASYAQLTMAFEENQRLLSNAVSVGKWLKDWGTASGVRGLAKRFCQLLSPTKRAAHAAVRIQAAVRGHQRRNLTKRAAQCASKPSGSARPSVSLCCLRPRVGPPTHRRNGARMGHDDAEAEDPHVNR